MKRMVLISVLSLLDFQLSGVPSPEFYNTISINYCNDLCLATKSIVYSNLVLTTVLPDKNICYLSPLKSKPENSYNTSVSTQPISLLAEENNLKIAARKLFPNGRRISKYRPVVYKSISIQIKVPP
jgi:hypothetical protein